MQNFQPYGKRKPEDDAGPDNSKRFRLPETGELQSKLEQLKIAVRTNDSVRVADAVSLLKDHAMDIAPKSVTLAYFGTINELTGTLVQEKKKSDEMTMRLQTVGGEYEARIQQERLGFQQQIYSEQGVAAFHQVRAVQSQRDLDLARQENAHVKAILLDTQRAMTVVRGELESANAARKALLAELREVSGKRREAKAQLEATVAELKRLKDASKDTSKTDALFNAIQTQRDHYKYDLDKSREQNGHLQSEGKVLQSKVQELTRTIDEQNKQIKELTVRAQKAEWDVKFNTMTYKKMEPILESAKKRAAAFEGDLKTSQQLLSNSLKEIDAMKAEIKAKDDRINELEARQGRAPFPEVLQPLGIAEKMHGPGAFIVLGVGSQHRYVDKEICYFARFDSTVVVGGIEYMYVTYYVELNDGKGNPVYKEWKTKKHDRMVASDSIMVALNERLPETAREKEALLAYLRKEFPNSTNVDNKIPQGV